MDDDGRRYSEDPLDEDRRIRSKNPQVDEVLISKNESCS